MAFYNLGNFADQLSAPELDDALSKVEGRYYQPNINPVPSTPPVIPPPTQPAMDEPLKKNEGIINLQTIGSLIGSYFGGPLGGQIGGAVGGAVKNGGSQQQGLLGSILGGFGGGK